MANSWGSPFMLANIVQNQPNTFSNSIVLLKNEKKRSKRNDTNNNVGINVSAADAVFSAIYFHVCCALMCSLLLSSISSLLFFFLLSICCVVAMMFNQFPSVFVGIHSFSSQIRANDGRRC